MKSRITGLTSTKPTEESRMRDAVTLSFVLTVGLISAIVFWFLNRFHMATDENGRKKGRRRGRENRVTREAGPVNAPMPVNGALSRASVNM